MATHIFGQKSKSSVQSAQVAGGARFDWAMIAVCSWLIAGAYSDVWAHNHLPIDNFFTPWHGLLYSGYIVTALFLVGSVLRNRLQGYSLWQSIPAGYELSLLGVILFFFCGIGDMVWHIVFGIEKSVDAALSPTHIGVAVAATMIFSGPFWAAWQRQNRHSRLDFVGLLPMLFSLTFTLALINVLAEIGQPFISLWPTFAQQDDKANHALAVVSIIFQTTILMGWVLLTLRRWTLPFGSFTLVFTLFMAFVSVAQYTFLMVIVALLAGLITDVLVLRLQPSVKRPNALRLFAFLVPVTLFTLYFLSLLLTSGIYWTVHLWMGSIFAAGLTGFLLSYLLVPPQLPTEANNG
ncbi:MAG TPA: hypothetical protein VKR06_09360 [Ktedonosporobacter sp.]|nr:hypothetical protein [Ktedonosporobacter sp.]